MSTPSKDRSALIQQIAIVQDQIRDCDDRDDYGPRSKKLAARLRDMKAQLAAMG